MYIKITIYINILILTLLSFSYPSKKCYSNNGWDVSNVCNTSKKLSNISENFIKSVKCYKSGFELNLPIIEISTDETLTVEFDDLSDSPEQYEYTIIHCDYNWQTSGIPFIEFAEGFEYTPIYDYKYSSGTLVQYRHYSVTLPNNDVRLKLSGNFVLQVVKQSDRARVVLQRKFQIFEPKVKIDALVRQPVSPNLQKNHQQLELCINTAQLGQVDPSNDITIIVLQNSQSYNQQIFKRPNYIDKNTLVYHTSTSPVFEGGNEFRQLNIKSFYYQTPGIQAISNYEGVYHTILSPDSKNKSYPYTENQDINGKFIVKCDDVSDSPTQADYTWVYFTLTTDIQFDGDLYLFGELTGWELNPSFKLNYNPQSVSYETRLLLKQGFYNYKYVFVSQNQSASDFNRIESTFFETENSYTILVYYKSPGIRYWQLVGVKVVNSRFKR